MRARITGVFLLAGFVLGGCVMATLPPEGETIQLDEVPFVYSAGKQVQTTINVNPEDWARIEAFFKPPATTRREERHQIRYAIAIFEQVAGSQTPPGSYCRRNSC